MESLGDWSWPGKGGASAEALPPPWVPALPPRLEQPAGDRGAPGHARGRSRRVALGALLSAAAALGVALGLSRPHQLERALGYGPATSAPTALASASAAPLPALRHVLGDPAGSAIDTASYHSSALHGSGRFFVYLPAGYASTTMRYPVLYLLHGNDQPATAFLEIGIQAQLDRLIARHAIPPMIVVMIQGGPGANNWRLWEGRDYGAYVLEVQRLVDRMLPTVPARAARAIAGDSMGGYGAMRAALENPYRFSVVESWLGFFNGLEGALHADRAVLARLGLYAFLYGASADTIADPTENAPFAAALRDAGASAHSATYPGEHSLDTIEAHLGSMLIFAGRALAQPAASARGRQGAR